jgi:hypothetical protein
MSRPEIFIIAAALIILLVIFAFFYVFNIYEVIYLVQPDSLYADNHSTATITAQPINSFGWAIPFRKVAAEFEIKEGNDLVEIILKNNEDGKMKLRAKNKTGTVVVFIKSKYALLPSSVEIHIYQNLAFK